MRIPLVCVAFCSASLFGSPVHAFDRVIEIHGPGRLFVQGTLVPQPIVLSYVAGAGGAADTLCANGLPIAFQSPLPELDEDNLPVSDMLRRLYRADAAAHGWAEALSACDSLEDVERASVDGEGVLRFTMSGVRWFIEPPAPETLDRTAKSDSLKAHQIATWAHLIEKGMEAGGVVGIGHAPRYFVTLDSREAAQLTDVLETALGEEAGNDSLRRFAEDWKRASAVVR
ncbi:MAG: hypothetical protein R3B81_01705 [bacterium]